MMQRCQNSAKQLASKGTPAAKKEAVGMISRMKLFEQKRALYLQQQLQIDQLQMNVDSAQLQADAVAALKAGQADVQRVMQEHPLEEIEFLVNENGDLIE